MNRPIGTLLLALALLTGSRAHGQNIPDPMSPPRLVNDFAGLLSQSEWGRLEGKLRAYHDTTSTQLYIVIVNDLLGYDIADFAFRIGEKWGVGQKGRNNGAVIVLKPKVGNQRGQAFIATGYGLEGAVPDAVANRIVEQEMIPYFRQNGYLEGLDRGTSVIIDLAQGLYTAEEYGNQGSAIPAVILGAFILLLVILSKSKHNRVNSSSLGKSIPFWLAMSMLGGSGRRSGYGNFSSGSGSFGGGGAGGSFGGGGAGGSW